MLKKLGNVFFLLEKEPGTVNDSRKKGYVKQYRQDVRELVESEMKKWVGCCCAYIAEYGIKVE